MEINKMILNYLRDVNSSAIDKIENPDNIIIARILDSLSMLEFLSFVEKTFDINIDEADVLLENFQYVHTVVEFVKKKRKMNHVS